MLRIIVPVIALAFSFNAMAAKHYGAELCKEAGYHCIKTKRGDSWERLFKDPRERDIVKRVNRMNVHLYPGIRLAVPNNLSSVDLLDLAPFPKKVPAPGKNKIVVNQRVLAWGAYDPAGNLLKWGPMSGGKGYCPDTKSRCRTITGDYTFYRKQGGGCVSRKFPIGKGGAKMPWCMFFHGGYAMHGSYSVPGYHASHGCVRIYPQDAQWLNTNFVKIGSTLISILPK